MSEDLPSPGTPSTLYKYYPPERLDIFEALTVRFSSPEDFNDLFDTNWEAPDSDAYIRHSRFRHRLGIFCLTEDPDNQLMWVHYAARHKGFVIGFDTSAALFSADGAALRRVRYAPPPADLGHSAREYCCFKAEAWSYEKEWRCVRMIRARESRDIPLDGHDIREVIVGSDMPRADVTALLLYRDLLRGLCDFGIWESKIDVAHRRISHGPCVSDLCPACHGSGQTRDQGGPLKSV